MIPVPFYRRTMGVLAALALIFSLDACHQKKPAAVIAQQEEQQEAAIHLAKAATPAETKMKCISIDRAIDMARMVETDKGIITGLHDAGDIDRMMRRMGYSRSSREGIYQQGRAVMYTQGCDVDDMGSIVAQASPKATLVTIAGEGQPATSALVSISMTDEGVYNQLRQEMAQKGFVGPGPELTNGSGYKLFADQFLSGTGYIIQISRE